MAAVNNTTSTLFGATANLPGGLWALLFLSALWVLLLRVNFIDKNSIKSGANSRKNKRRRSADRCSYVCHLGWRKNTTNEPLAINKLLLVVRAWIDEQNKIK